MDFAHFHLSMRIIFSRLDLVPVQIQKRVHRSPLYLFTMVFKFLDQLDTRCTRLLTTAHMPESEDEEVTVAQRVSRNLLVSVYEQQRLACAVRASLWGASVSNTRCRLR